MIEKTDNRSEIIMKNPIRNSKKIVLPSVIRIVIPVFPRQKKLGTGRHLQKAVEVIALQHPQHLDLT